MKFFATAVFILITCSSLFGKISVRGKIVGYDGKSKVLYSPTLEGIFAPYSYEILPAPNGTFKIEYENPGYGNIKIYYKGMSFRFFHDSKSNIYFEINERPAGRTKRMVPQEKLWETFDSVKRANPLKISGDYEAVNRFYNQNVRSSYVTTRLVHGTQFSILLSKASTPQAAIAKCDSLSQIEITQVDKLPHTEEVRSFLKNEIYAFYDAIFLCGMYLKRINQVSALMKDSTSNLNIYNREWEVEVEKIRAHLDRIEVLPNSPDYNDFMEAMIDAMSDYKKYQPQKIQDNTMDIWVENRLLKYDTTILKNEKARYAYELNSLYMFLDNQMVYSATLLNAVNSVQEKRGGSKHLEFFKPKIEKLKKYLESATSTDQSNLKIITLKYKTFNDLIKTFEGKNVFIDVWATWCGPCVEEFKYKSVVQSFADKGDIEILYISVDKPQWEDRWRQSIKVNELAGNHFRGDKQFLDDMWKAIGDEKGVIPRCVLIDKKGKIFRSTAAHPSNAEELQTQIRLLINQ